MGAFKGAELIGFIGGLLAHTDFHITTVATKKSHRCSGVGSFLLLRMLKEVDALCDGIETITLRCVLLINRLRDFTESLVLLVGLRRGYYQADNEDAIVMTIENLQGRFLADRLSEIELELSLAVLEM
ncbi:MAG: hypothetical protein CM15mP49_18200 [Actinomycetota bacterium]|nr:MAG: hypothetical protein CM15mP49_18200 [Actinomycetota bacterium]